MPQLEIAPIILRNRMDLVEDPALAPGGALIVDDPGKPPRSLRWIAILSGAAIVNKEYFLSDASHGSCMSWLPAIAIRRTIWLSAAARAADPLMAGLITWASRLPASKWQLRSDTWDEATYIARQKRVATVLGVITEAEKADVKFAHKKSLLYNDFLNYVAKLDTTTSGYKSEAARGSSG